MTEKKVTVEQFFMVDNHQQTKDIVVSERFKDAEGNPIKWTIKSITERENKKLKEKYTSENGMEFDGLGYSNELVTTCVVSPNLADAKLQDFYGVFNEIDLLEVMLTSGEFTRLSTEISKVNGFTTFEEKVKTVKNS